VVLWCCGAVVLWCCGAVVRAAALAQAAEAHPSLRAPHPLRVGVVECKIGNRLALLELARN
jgi:hypothetical protein